jgi:pyridinium-3,5-bisthiocarboxylic acid mononucleotide nickel chelatase
VPEQANILRLFVGTVNLPAASDRVWVLETNLDDLPGEVVGYTMTKLMEAGALDAFVTAIQMKKNRPGVMVSVLCDEVKIPALEDLLFRETATLGIRRYPVSRHKLKRQPIEVETPIGPIRGKLGWLGDRPPTFSPEFDDCARIAAAQAIPLREIYDAAHAAYARKSLASSTAAEPDHAHP